MPAYQQLSSLIKKNLEMKKGVHFYFIRHGQSLLNITNSAAGWTDCDLSPKGREQATKMNKALSSHVNSFNSLHTSDLSRCRQTLTLSLGLNEEMEAKTKISKTDLLRQLNFGDDEGVLLDTLPAEYLKVMNSLHYKAPNGEDWPQARQRAMKYLTSVAQEGHHFVSTHGGLLCALMYHLGLKQLLPNCSMVSAEFDPEIKDFSKIHFSWKLPQEN